MNIALGKLTTVNSDATLICGVFEDTKRLDFSFVKRLNADDTAYLKKFLHFVRGEAGEIKLALLPGGTRIVFIGLGKKSSWNTRAYELFIRRTVSTLKSERIESAYLFIDAYLLPLRSSLAASLSIAAQNLEMADYAHNKFKETPKGGWPKIKSLGILAHQKNKSLERALIDGQIIGRAVNEARILANTPGGDITPKTLAAAAVTTGKQNGFNVEIFDEKKIKELKMGGVLGVSQGSVEKPRFIVMSYGYKKTQKSQPLVLIGKGVTFDTGGLNIKPGEHMYEMHMDMAGGAAVIGAMSAIASLKLKTSVVGLVPAVENMPSGESYRPGDILTSLGGKTIEVLNTDAEGRIVLADALGYAVKYLNPKLMVDVATLTGAAAVALGSRVSAIFTNREKLERKLRDIGSASGDYVWPLPAWDEYIEDIKSSFADVQNTGKTRYGGAITAAVFLKQFVKDTPWVHIDIAPTMTTLDEQLLAKGASGAGVRYLVELVKRFESLKV